MLAVGINIGSTSVKAVCLDRGTVTWHEVLPHEGNVPATIAAILARRPTHGAVALATGNEGRRMVRVPSVTESLCLEAVLGQRSGKCRAVVSLGGEDLVVYTIDESGKVITSFSGNKCAAGTGEFFRQQLARMDMKLDDVGSIPKESSVCRLSTRCSVFMKSDCTHRLNKGEATKGDIVLSLANVMAVKVSDFLKRARVQDGTVVLVGGITRNPHLLPLLQEKMPDVTFEIPPEAAWYEAYGAALLAGDLGSPLPAVEELLLPNEVKFPRYSSLVAAEPLVTRLESRVGRPRAGARYVLGVDGGSTTTKVALIDMDTHEIAAAYYGRTHGDPVRALKKCIVEVRTQLAQAGIAEDEIDIRLVSTTGSSREILGVFLETPAVYNEIIAHAVGTTQFAADVDTIFEIGGQDAKYVLLANRVPIDYAMNEACSAGTGSFLEESAQGDLNIAHAWEIGEIAMAATEPLKFGQHCSAFINSDIRKAIQQGAAREDITAGLVMSIVSNYLGRVVGNRTIGQRIVLQGGVAKNRAVPLAFAALLNRPVLVPPDPELMGCFGVGLLALEKLADGRLTERPIRLAGILASEITYEKEFKCQACDNFCPIRVLSVNGHRTMFGGRCNKYANLRKGRKGEGAVDYVEKRNELLFDRCVPTPDTFVPRRHYAVGIPRAFSVHAFWPFYSWFFHKLGVKTVFSRQPAPAGMARVESGYCFPAEIAHGAVQDLLDMGVDFYFLPHFRDLESYEPDVHACFCPITQSLPYYIRRAFPEILDAQILRPVVTFKYGREQALQPFVEMGAKLGFSVEEVTAAFDEACVRQADYRRQARALGREALDEARAADRPAIALLGRPYNAFTRDANMGIPRKFTSNGYTVIPFDILPFEDEPEFPNIYWYFGQQDMKSAGLLAREENLYVTFISNFACAPDSFLLHYLRWTMGSKPYLVLELDSHSADAGIDTRVEAFLDIIDGYRKKVARKEEERYDNGLRMELVKGEPMLRNLRTGASVPVKHNPDVCLLLANMGNVGAQLMAASLRTAGWNSVAMPVPDARTLQFARQYASGKECLPSHLVLGSALQYFASPEYRKDTTYIVFVPETTGPCRTGQYAVYYENLFKDLRLENVVIMKLGSPNGYNELGPSFSRHAWWGIVLADYLKDIETVLRTCAADRSDAMARFDHGFRRILAIAETDVTNVLPTLQEVAEDLRRIPLRRNPDDCPKVLVVGEIYVRRDDFAVDEMVEMFSNKGIIAKVSGITEWLYYCDFTQAYELRKRLRLMAPLKRIMAPETRELLSWHVRQTYKRWVDRKVREILMPTGLVPESPHDMLSMMDRACRDFVTLELESEITISSGSTAEALHEGYAGAVNISPFACLIGRVIEGVVAPWARDQRFPMMSVEIDGNLLSPTTINKLEIFMLNVLRKGRATGTEGLVDAAPQGPSGPAAKPPQMDEEAVG
ncbi:MAG: activase [Deltaproteobacteria bacterium]|nr:activase [Deltaproteobacteria bacterium]